MTRLPIPGSDDGNWGTILNDFLGVTLGTDGTIKAGTISESQLDAGVQTKLNSAGGTATDLSSSTTTTTVTVASSTGNDAILPGATGSAAGVLTAADKTKLDGIATGAQVNAVTSVASRTGAVTLSKSDVGLANVDNTSDVTKNSATATLTNKTIDGGSNTLSNIPESAVTNLQTDLDAKIPFHQTYTTVPGSNPIERLDLNYTVDPSNPDVQRVYTNGFEASWRNEWGALRGTSPYANYGDALVRAVRTDADLMGTTDNGTEDAFEIVDRRTGAGGNIMWGRSWMDGHLRRNGIDMADSIVLGASDPVPATLPAGTIIIRTS